MSIARSAMHLAKPNEEVADNGISPMKPKKAKQKPEAGAVEGKAQDTEALRTHAKGESSDLHLDTRNYRKHNDRNKKLIRQSLEELGAGRSIVADREGEIVAGNGVFEQAQKLKIPVRVIETDGSELIAIKRTDLGTEDPRRKKLALADNATSDSSEWEYDLLAEDWDSGTLAEWGIDMPEEEDEKIADGETDPDDAPEVDETVEPCSVRGEVYQLGCHRLMCGDSTSAEDVAVLMNGEKADMVFTDPPYGVSYTGGIQFKDGYVEHNNREMICNDDVDIYEDVFRILSQFANGACYIWFAGTKAASLYNAAERYGEIHALIIWVKNGGYGALNANYKQKHKPCLYWKPKSCKLNFCGPTTETTIWEINKDGVNEYHPTQKPVALPVKAIRNHDANTVLDLFGGSGSTLIACEQTNRQCRMMELDEHYCDVIRRRWAEFVHGQGCDWQSLTPAIEV